MTKYSLAKTVRFSEQIMSTNKYPSIFSRKMEPIVYISSLYSADELQEGRNSCPMLRSCFIDYCHVGVFHVVSALQTIVCLYIFFMADQISCKSHVGSVYRMRSLTVSRFSTLEGIRVLNKRSVSDGGNLCPLWLEILKLV